MTENSLHISILKEKGRETMANIKPFLCIRPAEAQASRIAALPYDVYNRQEAKQEVEREPLSFLRIDRPETNFADDVDLYEEKVYQRAHDLLWQMVEEGYFLQEQTECFYIYELTMEGRVMNGLVACASIDDYLHNVIKKHENTREEKEQDRIRHVDSCGAQTGPIFLAYRARSEIRQVIGEAKQEKALYDFVARGGVRHRVFAVRRPAWIQSLIEAFARMDQIYIADGHHRAASAVQVGLMRRRQHSDYDGSEEFNYFLSVLFAHDELLIMDYNRVVKDLGGYSKEQFLQQVRERFVVGEAVRDAIRPQEKGEFCMRLGEFWYRCRIPREARSSDPVAGLDVSILQERLLAPVLGIQDPRVDARIDFVGGIRGLSELERRVAEDCAVAFAMYPTSIEELFAVADAGRLMPPKSTWFEPKLLSGLFIHKL